MKSELTPMVERFRALYGKPRGVKSLKRARAWLAQRIQAAFAAGQDPYGEMEAFFVGQGHPKAVARKLAKRLLYAETWGRRPNPIRVRKRGSKRQRRLRRTKAIQATRKLRRIRTLVVGERAPLITEPSQDRDPHPFNGGT